MQKWELCRSKLLQERLLVQQLEAEAAQMRLAEPRAVHENVAFSTSEDSLSPSPPVAKQQLHPSKPQSAGLFMSLPAWSGSAADTRELRRQSQPQHTRGKGFMTHASPLRRSSSHGGEAPHEHDIRRQKSREQFRGRNTSPLRRGSAPASSDAEAGYSSAASDLLPCMRRSKQHRKPSQASGDGPGRRTPVLHSTVPSNIRPTNGCMSL